MMYNYSRCEMVKNRVGKQKMRFSKNKYWTTKIKFLRNLT